MRLRPELAMIVREMSERTDLPVDTILEDAVEVWVRSLAPSYSGVQTELLPHLHHSPLVTLTRHDGTELR